MVPMCTCEKRVGKKLRGSRERNREKIVHMAGPLSATVEDLTVGERIFRPCWGVCAPGKI